MRVDTPALVLATVRYGDSDVIVKMFTESYGLRSYMIRGLQKSKKGAFRPAMFQPLTQLQIQALHRDKGQLERLIEAKVTVHYNNLHTDIIKSSMALFLAEVFKMTLQEQEPNAELFGFLSEALLALDAAESPMNFHLKIVLELQQFLGCYPDFQNGHFPFFNLEDGIFQESGGGIIRQGSLVEDLCTLAKTPFGNLAQWKTNTEQRRILLDLLMDYMQMHATGFKRPKSIEIYRQVFG
jgi:DNA repair protein RecO (recombination protein O)